MLYDILAIQTLYGVSPNTNAGNNRGTEAYRFKTGADAIQAIWDADGADEIDASDQSQSVTIDLRPGHFSFVGKKESTSVSQIAIAFQVTGQENNWIESATGGSGKDTLIGNDTSNWLRGGGDDDTLTGGKGDDILEGGIGHDTYVWNTGDGTDTIIDADKDGVIKINGGTGQLLFVAAGAFVETARGSGVWKQTMKDGSVLTLTHHSPWRLITADGSEIILGDDWQDGNFGIHAVSDVAPVTNLTLAGDLKPIDQNPNTAGIQLGYDALGNVIVGTEAEPNRADTLYDSAGNDHLQGFGGDDSLLARAGGNDLLEGGEGRDILDGGMGNDELFAGEAIDVGAALNGGEYGGATTDGSYGDFMGGGVGDDTLVGSAQSDAIMGGEGADIILGGAGNDFIFSDATYLATNNRWTFGGLAQTYPRLDYVDKGMGNGVGLSPVLGSLDTGAGGDDVVYGGSGGDWVLAGRGNDVVYGESGNDMLDGGAGDDMLFGGEGDDSLDGDLNTTVDQHGDDYLDLGGGQTHQFARGGGGSDIIIGGDTDDTIEGDVVISGRAADFHGNDYIDAKGGNDTVWGEGGSDTIFGGSGNDQLSGDTKNIALQYHGDDLLYGGEGDDILDGDGGNDTLDGGAGIDSLVGGAGDDLYLNVTGEDTIADTEGHNTIRLATANGVGASGLAVTPYGNQSQFKRLDIALDNGETLKIQDAFFGTGATIEFANGNALDLETLVGTSLTTAVALRLGDAGGKLYGGAGGDALYGGLGADKLYGYLGNDSLEGGGGNDMLDGGEGDDSVNGGEGDDTLDGGAGHDSLWGGGGTDIINGNSGSDKLWGNGGADVLNGGAGHDTLTGGEGADILIGGDGDDVLYGEGGDDTINGGIGRDRLSGGAGADTYLFDLGWGRDIVEFGTLADGKNDLIQFSEGISPEDIQIHRLNEKLILSMGSATARDILYDIWTNDFDSADFQGFFYNDAEVGMNIKFADGTIWDINTIKAKAIVATSGNDYLWGYSTADTLNGLDGDDHLIGLGGNDTLFGGLGIDYIDGGEGDDLIDGGFGDDQLSGGGGSDTYLFNLGWGQDRISNYETNVNAGQIDVIQFTFGISAADINVKTDNNNLVLTCAGSTDKITVGLYFSSSTGGTWKIQQIKFADGTVWDQALIEAKARVASTGDDWLYGSDSAETIAGLGGNDFLDGGAGDDSLDGGEGADSLVGGAGNDVLKGGIGNDTLDGGTGSDSYIFDRGWGQDTVINLNEVGTTDVIEFGVGISASDIQVRRGDGFIYPDDVILNDVILSLKGSTDSITIPNFLSVFKGINHNVIDEVRFADGTVWDVASIKAQSLLASGGNDVLAGYETADLINGLGGNDELYGEDGNDVLNGGAGDDTLYGGQGDDVLDGGIGNDILYWDVGSDTYLFSRGWGQDQIYSDPWDVGDPEVDSIQFAAGISASDIQVRRDPENTDNLILTLIGTTDTITVRDYFYNNNPTNHFTINKICFSDGTVWDQAAIEAKSKLASNGDDRLYGFAGADTIEGLGGNDFLSGGGGDDSLDGGEGVDTLAGGTGNDYYIVDNAGDVVVENAGEGDWDSVKLTLEADYTLADNVETVTRYSLGNFTTNGNDRDNYLLSNNAGNDTLIGLGGNDGLFDFAGGNDVLDGDAGNDYLYGGVGADTLIGGVGDDYYFVDEAGDVVTENADEGLDTVQSSITYALGANVENLILTGTDALNGTGNALDNTLTGNEAANELDGGLGADTLVGGLGNDHYYVDNIGDNIIESSTLATELDIVYSTIDYTLGANLEYLILKGDAAVNGTGNALSNALIGNEAANTLDGGLGDDFLSGGLGADTLVGGLGNDAYFVYDIGDQVVESVDEGIDSVYSSISFALGAELENLTLIGSDMIDGTGNSLDNVLTGNDAVNTLTGGAGNDRLDGNLGADTLIGGTGDDTYVVDDALDIVTENPNEGFDSVQSSLAYTRLTDNVELLTMTNTDGAVGIGNGLENTIFGNMGNDALYGLEGNDVLIGASGADYMAGGLGDDIFVVDDIGDQVVESANEGIDTVLSSVTFALSADLEELTLIGSDSIDGTGNALNNTLTGNEAANELDGGLGADTLVGGLGNDHYYVDNIGDIIIESSTLATDFDIVYSTIDYTLGANLEYLILTGAAAVNGTGNALSNALIGNAAANMLDGGLGDDFLSGGLGADTLVGGLGNDAYFVDDIGDVVTESSTLATEIDSVYSSISFALGANLENLTLIGSDMIDGTGNALDNVLIGNSAANTLTGGAGNDTYILGRGYYGTDTVIETDATAGNTDIAQFMSGVSADQLWFMHSGNNLEVDIIGADDKLIVQDWYTGSANHIEQFKTTDGGLTLLDSQVENLVNAMAAFAPPAAGQTSLPADYQATLAPVIAANWQ